MNYNIFKKACAILKDEDTMLSDESRKQLVEIIEAAENLPDCSTCSKQFYYPSPLTNPAWTTTPVITATKTNSTTTFPNDIKM